MTNNILILTGFMGSGKSSVGSVVAQLIGYQFVDLDAEIVKCTGTSINDIFAGQGEDAFRRIESLCLKQLLSASESVVVATGGGVVLSAENRALMREKGTVINLKASLHTVLSRLTGCTDRPLLAGNDGSARVEALMVKREQFYADADIRIDTDGKSVEDVSQEISWRFKELFQ